MFKVRLAVLGALALFIVSGIAASTASASGPFWHVGGTKFEAGTRQIKLQSKGVAVLKSPLAGLEIECKNSISEGATIEGSKETQGQGKGRVSYSSCVVLKPTTAGCTVAQPIVTNPLKAYLAEAATQTNYVEVFEPGQGIVFVTLKLTNCKPLGEVGVDGSIAAEIIPTKANGQEGMIAFPSTAISKVKHEGVEKTIKLETVGDPATFNAVYAARLATFPETFGVFET